MSVLDEDMFPNTGEPYYPKPSVEQESEESAEQAIITGSYPIFDELMSWFDEHIAATDSIKEVHSISEIKNVPRETVLIAFEIVNDLLSSKKTDLEALRQKYKR